MSEEEKQSLIDFCRLIIKAEAHAKRINSDNYERAERAEIRASKNHLELKEFWSLLPEDLKKMPLEDLIVSIGGFDGSVKEWLVDEVVADEVTPNID